MWEKPQGVWRFTREHRCEIVFDLGGGPKDGEVVLSKGEGNTSRDRFTMGEFLWKGPVGQHPPWT